MVMEHRVNTSHRSAQHQFVAPAQGTPNTKPGESGAVAAASDDTNADATKLAELLSSHLDVQLAQLLQEPEEGVPPCHHEEPNNSSTGTRSSITALEELDILDCHASMMDLRDNLFRLQQMDIFRVEWLSEQLEEKQLANKPVA